MTEINEGAILLASLIGEIHKTEAQGVYRFEHKLTSNAEFGAYKTYLTRRLEFSAWPSSRGYQFVPAGEIMPAGDGRGFNVLVRLKP
jgi:hypothetical protein